MKLPVLGPSSFERLLQYLLTVRGMDVDDAMDWIEGHYDVDGFNDSVKMKNR